MNNAYQSVCQWFIQVYNKKIINSLYGQKKRDDQKITALIIYIEYTSRLLLQK
jgi:hypothetical protein